MTHAGEASAKIPVVIAGDQMMVLGALAASLEKEDDIEVVAQAPNGREALEAVRNYRPDVFIGPGWAVHRVKLVLPRQGPAGPGCESREAVRY
jgi:two-component system response regulator DesR